MCYHFVTRTITWVGDIITIIFYLNHSHHKMKIGHFFWGVFLSFIYPYQKFITYLYEIQLEILQCMLTKIKCLKNRGVFILIFKNVQKIFMITNNYNFVFFSMSMITKYFISHSLKDF
jgi:hypothetical protein